MADKIVDSPSFVSLVSEVEHEVEVLSESTASKQRHMDGSAFHQTSPKVCWSRRRVQAGEKLAVACYGTKIVAG